MGLQKLFNLINLKSKIPAKINFGRAHFRTVYNIPLDETYEKSIQVEPEAEALDGVLVAVEDIRPHSCEGLHRIWGP